MPATRIKKWSLFTGLFSVIVVCAILLVSAGDSQPLAGDKTKFDQKAAYKLFQSKCLGCHVSVADPEKPGRTRDGWFLVVNVMHDYGVDLNQDESAKIVDLLYKLRKGMERDPG